MCKNNGARLEGSQPSKACGPNNEPTQSRWPTAVQLLQCDNCCTSTEQKYKQRKTTLCNTTCTTINAKSEPVCCWKSIYTLSVHDNVQNKSFSTLNLLLNFVFMATRVHCLPHNAFSKCILCTKWQFPCRNHFEHIITKEKVL